MTPLGEKMKEIGREAATAVAAPIIKGALKKYLGAGYPPRKLLRIYKANLNGEDIEEEDLLDLIEMFLYFAEHTLGYTFGIELLNHYLTQGGIAKEHVSPTILTGSADFRADFRRVFCPLLEVEIETRILDAAGGSHPAQSRTIRDENGGDLVVQPAPSVLRAGGTETIHEMRTIVVSQDEKTEHGMVFGGVGVICELTVTSAPTAPGEWRVTVDRWRCWAYDDGDFNNRDTQKLPISLLDYIPPGLEQEAIRLLKDEGIDPAEEIQIKDRYMKDLHGQTIDKKSVVTNRSVPYRIREFQIRFDPWEHTDFAGCLPTVVREPAP